MGNICSRQRQMDIILTGIVRAVMFGDFNIFSVLIYCWHRTFRIFAISWTSIRTQKPFFCLNLTQKQQNISTKKFCYPFYRINSVKRSNWDISFIYFQSYILTISKKKQQTNIQPLIPSVYVFRCKIEWKQRTTTYMSRRCDFALSLILGLQNVLFCVICSVALLRPEV